MRLRSIVLSIILQVVITATPAAQEPPPTVATDTIPIDTLVADSIALDSIAADTVDALPPDPAADSIMAILREVEGYTRTEYDATRAVYQAETGILRLQGAAVVEREDQRLTADTIVYNRETELVSAWGEPSVSGQAQDLTAEILYYDLVRKTATALAARTELTQGGNWHVRGETLQVETGGETRRVYASHATFTSCDLEVPHYHFASDEILVITDNILVARPARLYFGEVPVMWLPFIVQNLQQGRRSGLLVPRFGINDIVQNSGGQTRQISNVGWYWAINDYLGAQLAGGWRSGAYTQLTGDIDFRWRRQFLNGTLSFARYWRESGAKELTLNASTRWDPTERTNLRLQGGYASSEQFVRESTIDPREVTQDLRSTLGVDHRFDWGKVGASAERRQSIATGDVSMTLPRLSITPKSITLFRAPNPANASWYNNATLNFSGSGSRSIEDRAVNEVFPDSGSALPVRLIPDESKTNVSLSQSLTFGNLSFNSSGSLNETILSEVVGTDSTTDRLDMGEGSWNAGVSYRQELIGSTRISPNLRFFQALQQDTLTGGDYIAGPMRYSFGAGLNTDLYGFFPGFGRFSTIRHHLSPSIDYGYTPAVGQTELQERVFGSAGGRARNVISLRLRQTFEAKVRAADEQVDVDSAVVADSLATDSAAVAGSGAAPVQAEKVTILSISTSALEYDFLQASETGSGFTTDRITNRIESEYFKGLNIDIVHDLFEESDEDATGEKGRFAPRLERLTTSFDLGPESAIFRWLRFGPDDEDPAGQGIIPGTPDMESDSIDAALPQRDRGRPADFTRAAGSGVWSLGVHYTLQRPRPIERADGSLLDRGSQVLSGTLFLPLTPNWAVNWRTDYSITDSEFGSHRLNFKRNLHRWQANFDFTLTPNGNTSFSFYVELIDNPDLKFDYQERNLGIDDSGGSSQRRRLPDSD